MSKFTPQRKPLYLHTILASAGLAVTQSPASVAQSADIAMAPASRMEEVVVRGVAKQYRPQDQDSATGLQMSLVDTPQAVSVITDEMLKTINAKSAYEATDLVPGVQRSGFGFGLEQIVMRGVFNSTQRVNEILLGNDLTSVDSYALERLEIVRGPATAIYGVTGSFGGEINSILKKPERVFALEVGGEVGSYDTSEVFVDVTGPLNEAGTVAGRLAGRYREFGLPLDIAGEDFPNYQSVVLGSLEWDIATTSTLRFSYFHQSRNMDPWDGGAVVENPDGSLSLPDADPEEWYFSHPDQSKDTLDIDFAILELEHEFANGIRSESKLAWNRYDEDLEYFYPFGPFGAYSLGDDEIYIYSYDIEQDGEELTFNQSLGADIELFGREHQVFAALEYSDNVDPDRFELLNSSFQGYGTIDMYGDDVYDPSTGPVFSDGSPFRPIEGDREEILGVRQLTQEETEDLKLSFQMLFNITDRLDVLAGVLYQDNETRARIPINRGENTPDDVTDVGFQETVFKFGATYNLFRDWGSLDDANLYYSYSEGFEPQTFTDGDGRTVSAPQEMEQHEIGIKTEWLGGAIGSSLALYDYEITNIEVSSSFLGSFGGFGSTVLEGAQETTGLEFEIVGEILPGWNLAANYAWTDAEIINPNNSSSTPPRTTPEHAAALTTSYEFLEGPVNGLRVGATYKYSDDYSFIEGTSNVDRFGSLVDGGYERVDLHASYVPPFGNWQNLTLSFNWHNIFDEDILVAKQGNPGYGVMFIDQQRMSFGVRYNFE